MKNIFSALNLRNHKIRNLKEGSDPKDAVNYSQISKISEFTKAATIYSPKVDQKIMLPFFDKAITIRKITYAVGFETTSPTPEITFSLYASTKYFNSNPQVIINSSTIKSATGQHQSFEVSTPIPADTVLWLVVENMVNATQLHITLNYTID